MTENMKADAPSTVVKSNTISEAPGPTIFVPMRCSWKKLVCDESIPVGPEGNTNSTLEICPTLAPNQRLLVDHTSKGNTEGDTSANKLPRLSELDPMVVVVLVSPTKGLPLESRTALAGINESVHKLVQRQFLVQPDDRSTRGELRRINESGTRSNGRSTTGTSEHLSAAVVSSREGANRAAPGDIITTRTVPNLVGVERGPVATR